MSKCAGAGRGHGQADSQVGQRKYSIPWTSCSVYKQGLVRGQEAVWSYRFHESESSLVWKFKLFQKFPKILDFGFLLSLLRD